VDGIEVGTYTFVNNGRYIGLEGNGGAGGLFDNIEVHY
jgi:hypothetical protein